MPDVKRTSWLEDLILTAVVAALTTVWLSLWLAWLLRLTAPTRSVPAYFPVVMASLVLAGAEITRLTTGDRWSLRQARGISGAAGCLAVAAAVWLAYGGQFARATSDYWRGQEAADGPWLLGLPVIVASAYLWRRGIQVGRGRVSHYALAITFRGGIVALALLLCANSLRNSLAAEEVLGPVLLFFALGLGGLAVTSLRREHLVHRAITLARFGFSRHWLATSVAVIGAILLGGLVTARFVAPESLQSLWRTLQWLLDLLAFGLLLVMLPIAYVAERLLAPLIPFLAHLVGQAIDVFRQLVAAARSLFALLLGVMAAPFPRLFSPESLEEFFDSPAVRASGRVALALLLLLGIGSSFWLAVRRFGAERTMDMDEIRESILSRRLLWAQLKSLFSRRRQRQPAPAPPYLSLTGPPDDARLIVRRAYQAMLAWAQTLSLPRAAGQTPRAYADVLAHAVPHGQEAIANLTTVYMLARYSAEAPSLEEAQRTEAAMAQLLEVMGHT